MPKNVSNQVLVIYQVISDYFYHGVQKIFCTHTIERRILINHRQTTNTPTDQKFGVIPIFSCMFVYLYVCVYHSHRPNRWTDLDENWHTYSPQG